ncbi:PhzF family phenazine biosynthesis protein [Thalassotalea sp. HSM 43]|uniref:PhzF family phenazine biosynthesis protein n=1 Tax=Thalassotalea sp. HSM 43 TaxID=2552945 RepID=UPI001080AE03|nr:PhzF family phenazine biosynthesis protein [Thalassotalea sp. HSM 43]QBY04362.1 PhzF family phenazine biosynthesis protein [Thalassotalea sp. HSM 43]
MSLSSVTVSMVSAFSDKSDGGNPAAVIELDSWLADELLQTIARQQAAPVTVFVTPENKGYNIRWFTQSEEIDLCGHGTIAAASVLLAANATTSIRFFSAHGNPQVEKYADQFSLQFPVWPITPEPQDFSQCAINNCASQQAFSSRDLVLVLASEAQVRDFTPNLDYIKSLPWHALIITAAGEHCDYVLRNFVPSVGIDEDAATGSAQCSIAAFWAKKLVKTHLNARQLSQRGGDFSIECANDAIVISTAATLDRQYSLALKELI